MYFSNTYYIFENITSFLVQDVKPFHVICQYHSTVPKQRKSKHFREFGVKYVKYFFENIAIVSTLVLSPDIRIIIL